MPEVVPAELFKVDTDVNQELPDPWSNAARDGAPVASLLPLALNRGVKDGLGQIGSWQVSEDKNLTASSTPAVAIGFSRRNIALLLAAIVGLAVLVSLLMSGGSGVTTAHAVDTTKTIDAKALTAHDCDATEWHFVITQISSLANAPAFITVTWVDAGPVNVPLSKFTGGVAHYVTTSNLDSTVESATATIYAGWSGQFNLSHGPCGPSPSPTPTITS